ncbi:GtrA family protein [Halomonadaceae bacterium KBTZ08]
MKRAMMPGLLTMGDVPQSSTDQSARRATIPVHRRALIRQIVGYGLVGAGGTVAHYIVLMGLVEWDLLAPTPASCTGFIVGALINHELNRGIVFAGTSHSRRTTLTRFMLIAAMGFLLNLAVMALLTDVLDVYYLLSQLLATLTVFLVTFAFNKIWTFQG